jgi:hypothetical protein
MGPPIGTGTCSRSMKLPRSVSRSSFRKSTPLVGFVSILCSPVWLLLLALGA